MESYSEKFDEMHDTCAIFIDEEREAAVRSGIMIDRLKKSENSPATTTVHLIEQDVALRAQIARRLIAAKLHVEIYANIREFVAFAPRDGVILIDDSNHPQGLAGVIDKIDAAGRIMPIVVFCDKPIISRVVTAMRARALNYLGLDVPDETMVAALIEAARQGEREWVMKSRVATCARLIENLSSRERQVLEMLVDGESNKGMARQLGLSPRTIEIHRTKLMGKLGAKSSAEAVKFWCTANLMA